MTSSTGEWKRCRAPTDDEIVCWCLHQGRYYAATGKDNRIYQMPKGWKPDDAIE